jgi:biopolymer transport protein ExbD
MSFGSPGAFGGEDPADDSSMLSDINITPLVDVVLVLLLIFMVTAPMLAMTLDVDLPEVTTGAPASSTAIIVSVGREGTIALDERVLSLEDVVAEAKRRHEAQGGAVYLRADRDVPYHLFISVLDGLRASGLDEVSLVTKPVGGAGVTGGAGRRETDAGRRERR